MQRSRRWFALFLLGVITPLLFSPPSVLAQSAETTPQEEAEAAQRALELFLREQRIFVRRGEIELELDVLYSTDMREEFALVDSDVRLAKIDNRGVDTTLIGRYGLIDNLELSVEVPFGYAEQKVDFGVGSRTTKDHGVGDIAGRLRYQLWHEAGARPDVTLRLRGKSRSAGNSLLGTEHWHVGAEVDLVKTLDPVVFFGGLGYTLTLERQDRDPGDIISFQLGMGFSLNDRVSFNMQVAGAYVGDTELNGEDIDDSSAEIVSLQFGVTVLVTKRLFLEPTVSVGLSDDATDMVVGINVPYQF